MAITEKMLGQVTPTSGVAVSIYSPSAGVIADIKALRICNTQSSGIRFSVYVDDNGSTYNNTTAIYFNQEIEAYSTILDCGLISMNNPNGNIAVECTAVSGCTFTIHGAEIT